MQFTRNYKRFGVVTLRTYGKHQKYKENIIVSLNSPNSANWRGSSLEEKKVWLTCPQLFAPVPYGKCYETNDFGVVPRQTYVKPMEKQDNDSCHSKT